MRIVVLQKFHLMRITGFVMPEYLLHSPILSYPQLQDYCTAEQLSELVLALLQRKGTFIPFPCTRISVQPCNGAACFFTRSQAGADWGDSVLERKALHEGSESTDPSSIPPPACIPLILSWPPPSSLPLPCPPQLSTVWHPTWPLSSKERKGASPMLRYCLLVLG